MNLKLVVAISVLAATLAFGQAPKGGPSADVPKPTMADVQKVIQTISGDKTKMQAFCDLTKLNQQMVQADQTKDTSTLQALGQKVADLTQKLGPDYVTLMDGLDLVDVDSGEGKENTASIEEIIAALESLDKRCE